MTRSINARHASVTVVLPPKPSVQNNIKAMVQKEVEALFPGLRFSWYEVDQLIGLCEQRTTARIFETPEQLTLFIRRLIVPVVGGINPRL